MFIWFLADCGSGQIESYVSHLSAKLVILLFIYHRLLKPNPRHTDSLLMLLDAEDFITLAEGIQVGQASSSFFPCVFSTKWKWFNVSHKHFSHTNQMKSSRDSVSLYFNGSISHNGVKPPSWPVFPSVLCLSKHISLWIYVSPMTAVP